MRIVRNKKKERNIFMELSLRDIKKIAHEIIDEELESHGLSANVLPLTFIEYNESRTLRKRTILDKVSKWMIASFSGGFYKIKNNTIVIFVDRIRKLKKIEDKFFRLTFVCYHEARHAEQKEFDVYNYDGFIDILDKVDILDYGLSHDSYSFEIGANLYSIRKTREYMKKHYPEIYEKEKEEIELLEKQYYLEYLTYDAPVRIDAAISLLKGLKKLSIIKTSHDSNQEKVSKLQKMLNEFYELLYIFLDDDLNFRKIKDIINNDKFHKLDKKIVFAMFSSKIFLNSIDFNTLSDSELMALSDALNYTCQLDIKQINWMEELNKNEIELMKYKIRSSNSVSDKIKGISSEISRQLSNIRYNAYLKNENMILRQNYYNIVNSFLQNEMNASRKL